MKGVVVGGTSSLRSLANIGRVTEKKLNQIGIFNANDFLCRDPYDVFADCKKKWIPPSAAAPWPESSAPSWACPGIRSPRPRRGSTRSVTPVTSGASADAI